MMNEEYLKKIMASVLKVDVATIDDNSSMDTIKTWDSLSHMNLILALEDGFHISIADEDAGNITSYKLIKIVLLELLNDGS